MEEILHHLGCTKNPVNSGVFTISAGAGFRLPTVTLYLYGWVYKSWDGSLQVDRHVRRLEPHRRFRYSRPCHLELDRTGEVRAPGWGVVVVVGGGGGGGWLVFFCCGVYMIFPFRNHFCQADMTCPSFGRDGYSTTPFQECCRHTEGV